MRGFADDCLEVYENHPDHLSNKLRLQEISILVFFQFCCKINRNQLQIVVETTASKPILILLKTEFKILRKKPGDEGLRVSLKSPRRG